MSEKWTTANGWEEFKMRYFFNVELSGTGNTPEEAWENAVEGFDLDPGYPAEVTATEEDEGDEEEKGDEEDEGDEEEKDEL